MLQGTTSAFVSTRRPSDSRVWPECRMYTISRSATDSEDRVARNEEGNHGVITPTHQRPRHLLVVPREQTLAM
jgi:hypothetical protein